MASHKAGVGVGVSPHGWDDGWAFLCIFWGLRDAMSWIGVVAARGGVGGLALPPFWLVDGYVMVWGWGCGCGGGCSYLLSLFSLSLSLYLLLSLPVVGVCMSSSRVLPQTWQAYGFGFCVGLARAVCNLWCVSGG